METPHYNKFTRSTDPRPESPLDTIRRRISEAVAEIAAHGNELVDLGNQLFGMAPELVKQVAETGSRSAALPAIEAELDRLFAAIGDLAQAKERLMPLV